jgi:hypothetical protein
VEPQHDLPVRRRHEVIGVGAAVWHQLVRQYLCCTSRQLHGRFDLSPRQLYDSGASFHAASLAGPRVNL